MTRLYEITYKDEQGNMNTKYPVAGQLKRTFASSGAIAKTELITVAGTTDGYKLAVEAKSSNNLEVQHILLDDVSTKEVWYGNSTVMMTLQSVGSGVNNMGVTWLLMAL